jgi:hypothetical protein
MNDKILWAAQLHEWPESIRIYHYEMLDWVNSIQCRDKREWLLTGMVNCLASHPHGIFYRTSNKPNAFIGYRFGVSGEEYVSGFPLWNGKFGC